MKNTFIKKERTKELLGLLEKEFDKNGDEIFNEHKETILHMVRCSEVAEVFGKFLGLPEEEIEKLSKCALLHDIGKISIPSNILYKQNIDEEEFSIIKTHVFYKYEASKEIEHSINYHHCMPEGRGYGWEISYEKIHSYAKICSLLDVYDVLTHKRCYKENVMNFKSVINEISANAGKQFDFKLANQFTDFLIFSQNCKIIKELH